MSTDDSKTTAPDDGSTRGTNVGGPWCHACQMWSASGCRHPLGASCCPHRALKETTNAN
jgi:hypothetical protein